MDEITRDLADDFGDDAVTLILHGSTAALNTLLEDKGVPVGLITTAGFRDVYEIGRQWRGDDVFNLFAPAPKMLLARDRIFEVRERLDCHGEVVEPRWTSGRRATRPARWSPDGVEAVAVAFLFAYANPRARAGGGRDHPRHRAHCSTSRCRARSIPEWREYERTASTVANAYIGPPVARYLHAIEERRRGALPARAAP